MDDVKADAKDGFRRVEVLTGPSRRRRWSDAEKARIVAEALVPGAAVSEVARRWQVCSQQVFTWRRQARAGHLVLPSSSIGSAIEPGFVPIVIATQPVPADEEAIPERPSKPASAPAVEIRLAGAVVRVAVGTDSRLLTDVLRAVRASAT